MSPSSLKYKLDDYENPSAAFSAAMTDSMFACMALALNDILAEKIPVYAYEFSDRAAPSYSGFTTFPLLAAHTHELAYIFPGFRGGSNVQLTLNPLQEELSKQMVDYFTNVAALPLEKHEWSRFNRKKTNIMTFALPRARMVSDQFAKVHHCAFWDQTSTYSTSR